MYAIVRTGGKQYRAEPNGLLIVEKLEVEEGSTIELDDVLMVGSGADVKIGSPKVVGAKVVATVIKQAKGKKIIGFRYKAKKNERKRFGHRQNHTYLRVTEIISA